jgi:hypothetical protein
MPRQKLVLYTLITLAVALTASCGGETVVTKVDPRATPGSQVNEGVLFSLPETVVMAEVPLTKVSSSPGSYSNWTTFFYPELTTDDFITEQKTAFKVGVATFTTRGQTDPQNVYIAHIKAKQFETKTLLLEFNEDGIVARTEASSKDESIDVITSGVKTVASIVAPLIGGGGTTLDLSDNASFKVRANLPVDTETVPAKETDCEEILAKARQAYARAAKAAEKAEQSGKRADEKAAETARQAAEALYADYGTCNENRFKRRLRDAADLALYESLDDDYKRFLRENFGYQFLTYLARRDVTPGNTGIQFFFTLNEKQQNFIAKQKRASSPCEVYPVTTTLCLATEVKLELLRAKAAYDKILELRKKRQDTLFEITGNDVNTSAHLEFRLKELDAQITSIEQTFFLGTSSETSGTAKFEFKPGDGSAIETQRLFAYSRGGSKPGVCDVTPETPGVFKALVPEPLKGECHAANYLISPGDLRDGKTFIKRLREHRADDRVAYYLYNYRLTRQTQFLLDGSTDNDKPQVRARLLAVLLADLQAVIEGANIYDDTLFQYVDLSGATIELRKKIAELEAIRTRTPEQDAVLGQLIIRLNRSLLDDAFSKELYRQSVWAAHNVSLSIEPRTSGLATSVRRQQLQENGRRGFPYRLAAVSMAKMFDDETEKGRSSVRIAQFGPVQSLPANLGGRRSSYKITYYDSTGAIKIFDMSADALIQKGNVTDLTDAATTLRDSEAARLKRETELLDLKKKKLDAEKALRNAAKEEPSPSPSPEP